MSVGAALRAAVRDFYDNSLRFLVLNSALSAAALCILTIAIYAPVALVLLLVLGPLAAAVMHCAVVLVREDEVRLVDAAKGVRLHWRRGLLLGALGAVAVALAAVAVRFYSRAGTFAWPLAALTLYVALLFAIFQLPLWALAVDGRDRPLRTVFRDAAFSLLRRPAAWTGLTVALFLINLAGVIAAVVPFLTLTVAYSFLAAARFALPRNPDPAVEG